MQKLLPQEYPEQVQFHSSLPSGHSATQLQSWYPTADGIRPSNADTSAPACTKRKILSINSKTSCLFTSRKYSAIVSAVKPTRIRAPGGSFVCPYTSATLDSVSFSSLITLDSFISQ